MSRIAAFFDIDGTIYREGLSAGIKDREIMIHIY